MIVHRPFVSIIIPVYNRARFVGRALDSCLNQQFTDFEIVVVDDGSADDSVAAVREYNDPRIRLIIHKVNLGVSAARNTGVGAARGDWIICLDSDDELTPGALATIHERATQVSPEIGGLRFMCRMEAGDLSPNRPLPLEIWDYERFIAWMESVRGERKESLVVVRRSTFEQIKYPDGPSLEGLYHLEFARHFLTCQFPDVVRIYHQDAENQLTQPNTHRMLAEATGRAQNIERLLARHGAVLSKLAPETHFEKSFTLAFNKFLSGQRLNGLQWAIDCLRRKPFLLRTWALMFLGLLGPRVLAWVQAQRARWS